MFSFTKNRVWVKKLECTLRMGKFFNFNFHSKPSQKLLLKIFLQFTALDACGYYIFHKETCKAFCEILYILY